MGAGARDKITHTTMTSMPPIIEGGRRRRTSRRPRSAAASFKSVALPLLLPLATMTTSMLLLLLLLPHLATVGVVVHAGPPPPDADCDDGNDDSATTATIKDSNRVFANINENYQSSSTSLDAVTRKIEDDYRKRQLRMRVYWKRIFEEIKVSNPVVFPPPDDDDDDDDGDGDEEHDDVDDDDDTAVYGEDLRRRRGRGRGRGRTSSAGKRMILDRWKQFLDGGAGGVGVVGPSRTTTTTTTVGDGEDVVAGADGGETIPAGGGGGGGSEGGEARVQQGPTASSSPLRRIPNLGEAAPADAGGRIVVSRGGRKPVERAAPAEGGPVGYVRHGELRRIVERVEEAYAERGGGGGGRGGRFR